MNSTGCFLCRFNTHKDAIEMTHFINENIGTMHLDSLSHEVSNELANRLELNVMDDSVPDSIHVDVIREHISSHTLNPSVRVGIMLRGLLDLGDKMKADLYKTDANGQNMGLDPKMIDVYLRLQNQIVNLYKCEPSKMAYNNVSNTKLI
jgi:hypothetical protein